MKATKNGLFVIASVLIILGMTAMFLSACSAGWDFGKLGAGDYQTSTYDITEEFSSISIDTDTADIILAPSSDNKCRVVCYEKTKLGHSVSVMDGVLTVNTVDTRKWYDYIGINFTSPKITVYLSESEYSSLFIEESTGDINISKDFTFKNVDVSLSTGDVMCYASAMEKMNIVASTGDIIVEEISANALNVSVSTGDVTIRDSNVTENITVGVSTGDVCLTNVMCKKFISTGSTGDVSLNNTIANENFSIERSTGNIEFVKSDASEIFINTDTGDINGSLLTDKVYIIQTDTGEIDVPKTTTGGKCEITTDTGDISIKIEK